MASRFQAASLVASPSYPNSIAWSDENLLAVATGHLVTILSPALPFGPRGLITIPPSRPFPIGVIKREDLLSGCLLPTCLSRDCRPCVRSISWSPLGLAPNAGCLLAVCTTEGCVKLYGPPFCEFSSEWVEVIDISDMLYEYLANIKFGELESPSSKSSFKESTELSMEPGCADDLPIPVLKKEHKRRRANKSGEMEDNNPFQIVAVPESKLKPPKKIPENCTFPHITADQYASRSAMLSSLVVAWSPVLQLSSQIGTVPPSNLSNCSSLLAVGGKSGKISFWRIPGPQCYAVEQNRVHTAAMLVGLLQAHGAWITAIIWSSLYSDASNPQVLLATGSSDGSAKIWLGSCEELLKSSEVSYAPFVLLNEVSSVGSIPVSVLSLTVLVKYQHRTLLAIGRGSGSFEVWLCDLSTRKFDKAGPYDAHDHVVTGLAWAFDGICLYSCSQVQHVCFHRSLEKGPKFTIGHLASSFLWNDNSVRCWIFHGSSLLEAAIPSNTLGVKSSIDIPNVSDSCFGVALSPGNLVIAVARSFDVELLNPMYQARTMKGAVEFFWIGGQQLDVLLNKHPELGIEAFPGFSEKELVYWESNVLWSLNRYEHVDRPLIVWDVIAALLAFKQCAPKFVEHIVVKWLSISFVGSHLGLSTEEVLSRTSSLFSKITSRQLQLLNIICRRVVLSEFQVDKINMQQQNLGGLCGAEEELMNSWMELLFSCERELRERLVGFSISAALYLMSCSAANISRLGCWHPIGLAQMEQWVALNHDHVQDKLQFLASEVGALVGRLQSICEYAAEEQCSYCSAPVPFESPEVAFCQGVNGQTHTLARCAISMLVCPTTPLWFCVCCQRWASKLAPIAFYAMPNYPSDFKSIDSFTLKVFSRPLCPFCGILLQRLQPDFLLSASPV